MLHRISYALSASSAFLVHRDLHQGNIILTESTNIDPHTFIYIDPGIRILDLGCSKDILKDLFNEWIEDKAESTYIRVNDKYKDCDFVNTWGMK